MVGFKKAAEAMPNVEDAIKAVQPDMDAAMSEVGPKPKLKIKNKKLAIIGAIVGVVAALGIGFYVWHETPEFCTSICHTPMTPTYLETLYANPYEPAIDKWGNEVTKAKAMLASVHGNMGKRCMACHVPSMEEQITEGIEWLTGNYYNPLSERDLSRLVFYRKVGETEFCLNPGCHNLTKDGLTNETATMTRNPHSWHHTEYTCSDCHKGHRASIMICSQCHEDAEVPAGWLTWEESMNLPIQYMSWNEEQFLKS